MKKRLLSIVFALLMLGALLSFSILAEGPAYDGDNEVPGQEWGNVYTITLPTGTGYTAAVADGFYLTVNEGDNFSFTVTIADGYEKDTTFAVKANGVLLTETDSVYTITEVIADQVITVEGVKEAEPEGIAGDINGDGRVNGRDVALLRRVVNEDEDLVYDEAALNVNGDTRVNGRDVALLRRYVNEDEGLEIYYNGKLVVTT